MLKLVFEIEDFQVFTAANGQEALSLLTHIPRPVMILLDLMMPVMNGWQFLEAQAQSPRIASIPVVIVTAFAQRHNLPLNVTVMKKPVDVDDLIQLAIEFSQRPNAQLH